MLQKLQRGFDSDAFCLQYTVALEMQDVADPVFLDAIVRYCELQEICLVPHHGEPKLGWNLNNVTKYLDGDLLLYVQDDFMTCRAGQMRGDAELLAGSQDVGCVRYHWGVAPGITVPDGDLVVLPEDAAWHLTFHPTLFRRDFWDMLTPFAVPRAEFPMNSVAKSQDRFKILSRKPVGGPIFRHIGVTTTLTGKYKEKDFWTGRPGVGYA
jgi:hypothetical protein